MAHSVHRVEKSNTFYMYLLQFLDKFYKTFSECPYINMWTDGDMILIQSFKYSLCSDVIMTLL